MICRQSARQTDSLARLRPQAKLRNLTTDKDLAVYVVQSPCVFHKPLASKEGGKVLTSQLAESTVWQILAMHNFPIPHKLVWYAHCLVFLGFTLCLRATASQYVT